MARPGAKSTSTPKGASSPSTETPTLEAAVISFAEQLGHVAGTMQAKAEGWLDGDRLNEQLTRIRDGAANLLNQLEGAAASASAAVKTASEKASRGKAGGPSKPSTRQPAGNVTARSRGLIDAPGKSHRKPPPTTRGVKKSDEMIPKARAAEQMRQRRRG